jgi:hypothetical protein
MLGFIRLTKSLAEKKCREKNSAKVGGATLSKE